MVSLSLILRDRPRVSTVSRLIQLFIVPGGTLMRCASSSQVRPSRKADGGRLPRFELLQTGGKTLVLLRQLDRGQSRIAYRIGSFNGLRAARHRAGS
jgi:hypothetical protein